MKQCLLFLLAISSLGSYGQFYANVNNAEIREFDKRRTIIPNRSTSLNSYYLNESERKEILKQQYLTQTYKPAYVDDFKTLAFLRYNHYNDQMEFVKGQVIYYLKKEPGRTVKFTSLKTTYRVFHVNGSLGYYKINIDGKNSLITQQSSKFIPARLPNGSYEELEPASFERNKDRLFIVFEKGNIREVPSKKRAFFKLFGKHSKQIKTYIEIQKLNYKVVEDIEKIVQYWNEL